MNADETMKTNRIKATATAAQDRPAGNSNNNVMVVPCRWAEESQFGVPITLRKKPGPWSWLTLIMACLTALLAAGCKEEPHYTTTLDVGEAIGVDSAVIMDGAPVGRVVEVAGSPRQAKIIISEPSAMLKMRHGVVRVKEQGQLVLVSSYVKPEAPTLPIGSEIPTQSTVEFVTRYGLQEYGTAALVALGVLAVLAILVVLFRWCRGCAMLVAMAVLVVGATRSCAADARQPGYSRDYLRLEQKRLEDHLCKAQAEADLARTRRAAGLNEMAERNLLAAQIALDGFKVEAAGHDDRVRALRASPLAYHRENQIKILTDNFNEMRGRQERLLEEITRMRQAQGEATNGPPQVLKSASPITNTVVITNTVEKAVTKTLVITNTVERPVIKTVVVTNTVEKPVIKTVVITNTEKAEVQKPLTNTVVIVRTNRVVVTNQERVLVERIVTNAMVTAKPANTNSGQAAARSAVREWSLPGKAATGTAVKASPPTGRPMRGIVAAMVGGLALAAVLGWVGYTSWMRGRPYLLKLGTAPGKAEDFEIGAMDEAVVLRMPPACEAQNFVNGSPCIVVGWLGARLRVGNEATVLLNATQVKGSRRLRPGDRIAVTNGSDQTQNYQFLDCAPMVPDAIEA